jgi:small subunit ribosomal protein S17
MAESPENTENTEIETPEAAADEAVEPAGVPAEQGTDGEPAHEPPSGDPADEEAAERAANGADAEAEAPARTPGPPPKPPRSAEERQAERDAQRRQKAAQRQRRRAKAKTKRDGASSGEGTPPREHGEGRPKVRQGVVTSDKADKTITVRIDVARRHRRYEKIVRSSSTLHAHDERNDASTGDTVRVVESRPLSRTKRWRLLDVVERAR